jgi:serine/threonine protein kinase
MADEAFLRIWQNSLEKKSNITQRQITTFLTQLDMNYNATMSTQFFTDSILTLNTMSLVLAEDTVISVKDPKNPKKKIDRVFPKGTVPPHTLRVPKGTPAILTDPKDNEIEVTYIGGGTYGEIWKSRIGGRTFKRVIPQDNAHEELARNFFLECWIQTVLSTDATYGSNVGKILGMYRDIGIVKRSLRGTGAVGSQVQGSKIFFIEMEYIPYGFESLFDNRELSPQILRGILIKIAEALEYFERTYSFFHRDFHMGNLMMGESGIKIIDFGMSCCTYNRITYSMPGNQPVPRKVSEALGAGSTSCASLDLLIFLMSIRDAAHGNRSYQALIDYIDSHTQLSNGETTYNKIMWYTDAVYGTEAAVWHSCYPSELANFDRIKLVKKERNTILDALLEVDLFLPHRVKDVFDSEYSTTGYALSSYPVVGSWLRPLRTPVRAVKGALGYSSNSPNSNLSLAISRARTLAQRKGGRAQKTRKNRKH